MIQIIDHSPEMFRYKAKINGRVFEYTAKNAEAAAKICAEKHGTDCPEEDDTIEVELPNGIIVKFSVAFENVRKYSVELI